MQPGYGQPPYGQSPPPYPQNQPYSQNPPPYGPQNYEPQVYGQQGPQPVYKQISIGQGIDMNEYNRIVDCCKLFYMQMKQGPRIAERAAEGIKQMLGGDWFVFVSNLGYEDFDFSLTKVKGGDFMAFSLDNKKFQICRIQ